MNKRLRVLVADDQESIRLLFVRVLRSIGYSCDEAVDGRDCLLRAAQCDYDVVFLDLVMPEIDGETVLRWFRTQSPRTNIIITSLQDDDEIIRRMLKLGASAYLVKPFAAQEVQSIMRALENRRTACGLELVAAIA